MDGFLRLGLEWFPAKVYEMEDENLYRCVLTFSCVAKEHDVVGLTMQVEKERVRFSRIVFLERKVDVLPDFKYESDSEESLRDLSVGASTNTSTVTRCSIEQLDPPDVNFETDQMWHERSEHYMSNFFSTNQHLKDFLYSLCNTPFTNSIMKMIFRFSCLTASEEFQGYYSKDDGSYYGFFLQPCHIGGVYTNEFKKEDFVGIFVYSSSYLCRFGVWEVIKNQLIMNGRTYIRQSYSLEKGERFSWQIEQKHLEQTFGPRKPDSWELPLSKVLEPH